MGLFDNLFSSNTSNSNSDRNQNNVIESGRNKNTGGHDHRTNKGDDRTPSQKEGDKSRRK
ncbi:hypothetical protein F975_02070 [Acinetobacter sp. ANC 3789]|uniref:hypothetical protein n=1 Tax=Acinetobacter sp. ANC 3789 TaxID=1217714 RepID=UPI0002D0AD0D|nr:hypothetical protein [Acinetobacter sp. ANC 3789]ENU80314.1 hypothetical protein F975_02070 [Acinetobacter sp. ANC 3789]